MGVNSVRVFQCQPDYLLDPFNVFEDLVVPESKYVETFAFEPSRSCRILFGLFGMLTTIEFNDQPCRETNEIYNVTTDRRLTPKFEAIQLLVAQPFPKTFSRLGEVRAKFAGI